MLIAVVVVVVITHADGSGRVRFLQLFVCLFFPHDVTKKPTQLGSPNVTQKCSTMSLGNPFIFGSKGQGHESHNRYQRGPLH